MADVGSTGGMGSNRTIGIVGMVEHETTERPGLIAQIRGGVWWGTAVGAGFVLAQLVCEVWLRNPLHYL